MERITTFIAGFIFAVVLIVAAQVSAGINSFAVDVNTAITNNFAPAAQNRIGDSFVSAYKGEWDNKVAAGTVDNNAQRQKFAADKIAEYVQAIVKSEQVKAAQAAVATPTPLP